MEQVETTELIRTSRSWDGVELPDYLQGRPEIVAIKYDIPAGEKLGWHHHPVMNFGILVQGELTIVSEDGNRAVALVTFGNRAYDNALAELVGLMEEGVMRLVGAAAMVTRHSFSDTLGAGRPNEEDLAALDRFAEQLAAKLSIFNSQLSILKVPGEAHPEKYYTPLKTNNAPAGFLKAKPSCNPDRCTQCGKCLEICPMGSIDAKDGIPAFDGICIKCQACRHICPTGAIAFTDPEYLSHVAMIERTFAAPKQPEFYVAQPTHIL